MRCALNLRPFESVFIQSAHDTERDSCRGVLPCLQASQHEIQHTKLHTDCVLQVNCCWLMSETNVQGYTQELIQNMKTMLCKVY